MFWSVLLLSVLMMFYFDNRSMQQQIDGMIASAAIVCLMFAYLTRAYRAERLPGQRSLGLPKSELFWSLKRKPQFEKRPMTEKGLNIAYLSLFNFRWPYLFWMAMAPFGSIILISIFTGSWFPLAIFIFGVFLMTFVFVQEGTNQLSN